MTAMIEIVIVALVLISLALEAEIIVGIAPEKQPNKPLHKVQYIKRHIEQLTHLCRVDALMIDQTPIYSHVGMHKKHAKKINGSIVARRWQISGANYNHRRSQMQSTCKDSEKFSVGTSQPIVFFST